MVKDILNCQQDELTTNGVAREAEGREEADYDENQEAPPRQLTTAELSDDLQQGRGTSGPPEHSIRPAR
ncbi:hypothetical protein M514_26547 [Trichuris suis]|uniref:Uncharacterized protein n=1 Tax=Trichuris suis TaxID=68888 RepID=A0A085MVQ3_9BILA|nr:hypothetical protein M514_26547 [Trichuris suis]